MFLSIFRMYLPRFYFKFLRPSTLILRPQSKLHNLFNLNARKHKKVASVDVVKIPLYSHLVSQFLNENKDNHIYIFSNLGNLFLALMKLPLQPLFLITFKYTCGKIKICFYFHFFPLKPSKNISIFLIRDETIRK